jgi:hypothetical protein
LPGQLEGKRPIRRPKCRSVVNIKMDLRQIWWGCMDCIDLAQDRDQWRVLLKMIMNLRVPYNVGKFLSSCTIGGFSRRAQLHEYSYLDQSNCRIRDELWRIWKELVMALLKY